MAPLRLLMKLSMRRPADRSLYWRRDCWRGRPSFVWRRRESSTMTTSWWLCPAPWSRQSTVSSGLTISPIIYEIVLRPSACVRYRTIFKFVKQNQINNVCRCTLSNHPCPQRITDQEVARWGASGSDQPPVQREQERNDDRHGKLWRERQGSCQVGDHSESSHKDKN